MNLRAAILSTLFFVCFAANAQYADYVILKKKGKAIQRYYTGSNIVFQTNTGAYLDATITQMKNDTLWLKEYILQKMITKFGFYVIDTLGSFYYKFHYNQIVALGPKNKKGFDIKNSMSGLFGGGVLLTLASLAVLAFDKNKFSPALLGASAGLGAFGYFLGRTGSKGTRIGKKYKLVYVKMS